MLTSQHSRGQGGRFEITLGCMPLTKPAWATQDPASHTRKCSVFRKWMGDEWMGKMNGQVRGVNRGDRQWAVRWKNEQMSVKMDGG